MMYSMPDLHKIYVMPDAQGRGVDLILFQTVENHVREEILPRKARIELNVNKFNPAVNFYRHRNRPGKKHQASCWTPTGVWQYYCPEKFGIVEFKK